MRTLIHIRLLLLLALLTLLPTSATRAQIVKELVNNQGANAPCAGIELGLGLIRKCIDTFADAGFIRLPELGFSGLTLGTTPADDGAITAVAPGSPAEKAGLHPGDRIVAVNDKPVRYDPATSANRAIFGPRGEEVHLKIRRAGSLQDVSFKRAPLAPPPNPKAPSFMFIMHPLIDARGVVIPCMGAGIAAPAAFIYCDKHFRPFGYIKFGDLATTGLHFDPAQTDAAIVQSVDPASPAATAGVQPGDEIIAVDDKPITPRLTEQVNEHIFGHPGDIFHLKVRSGSADKSVDLTLTSKPKDS